MKLFIDTEFNGYQGELISIALVGENGCEFYESLGCENPTPWVAENVMPVIGIKPILRDVLQHELEFFFSTYRKIHIVADWPEDIQYFCQLLITGPGTRIDTPPLKMEVRRDLDAVSLVPHNALEDARAIRRVAMGLELTA